MNLRLFMKMMVLLCLLLVICGCALDARELDHRSMILGMAVDKGEEDNMLVSLQTPILGAGEDVSPRQKESEVVSSADKTIFDAITHYELSSPRVLFFGHMKVVAISEEVARDDISSIVDFLGRQVQIGNQVLLVIVEGQKAKEFISFDSPVITLPSLYIDTYFKAEQKVSRTTDTPVFKYLRDIHSETETAFIPIGRITEGGEIKIKDLAIMKQHKMVGTLRDHNVSHGLLLKERKVENMKPTVSIQAGGKEVQVTLAPVDLKLKIKYKKTNPVEFDLRVTGTGEVHGKTEEEVVTSLDNIEKLKDQLNKDTEKNLQKVISEMQKVNVEPFLFGQYLFALDTKYYDTLDWNETGWKEAKFNISVDIDIHKTGMRGMFDKKKVGR